MSQVRRPLAPAVPGAPRSRAGARVAAPVLLAIAFGCAPTGGPATGGSGLDNPDAELADGNGLTPNGLITNGLITNGLITNGLITNGLAAATGGVSNGLADNGLTASALQTPAFLRWFNGNPESYSSMVMAYLVRCAWPSGSSLTWTNPWTGNAFTWSGILGLTPGWASGAAATEREQQLITACLAAHANKYGKHVTLSMLGQDALGAPIPTTLQELLDYPEREACFYGNMFTGEGVYSGADSTLSPLTSTVRACGIGLQLTGTSSECPPIVHVGNCASNCLPGTDPLPYYATCQVQGKSYVPITTRIRKSDLYQCGDGICQFTESCGATATSNQWNNCGMDCGVCPGSSARRP